MRGRILVGVVTWCCLAACGSFSGTATPADAGAADGGTGSSDGASSNESSAACDIPACPAHDVQPSCHYYDFTPPACPGDWQKNTGPTDVVTFECSNGKLHIAADSTFDITAVLSITPPPTPKAAHVSARIAVKDWRPGKAVLTIDLGGAKVFLDAQIDANDLPLFNPCTTTDLCAPSHPVESKAGEEHVFTFDIASTGVIVTMDCNTVWKLPAVTPDFSSSLTISFGMVDAAPIDATLDDVRISFD